MKKMNTVSIPAIYNDLNKTPLRQRVPPQGKVEIHLASTLK